MRETKNLKCDFCDKIRAEFSKASHFHRHVNGHNKNALCKEYENLLNCNMEFFKVSKKKTQKEQETGREKA